MYAQPRFLPAGDSALVVELGDQIDIATNSRVRALAAAIGLRRITGVVEAVPTYRSLLVHFDPLALTVAELSEQVAAIEGELADMALPPPRRVEIPTCYGGSFGPDLADVVAHSGLNEADVIALHAGIDYLVYMMGFITGFPYLGGLPARIATPRLPTPRTKVPAGSVGIAQQQTGIYPVESPGGWRLIGRTPVRWFEPSRQPPVPVEAGDYIRFVPVSAAEYERIRAQVEAGAFTLASTPCDR
jgi:inhibitor of KinA